MALGVGGQLRKAALVVSRAVTSPAGRMVCCLSVRQAGVPNDGFKESAQRLGESRRCSMS